RCVIRGRFLDDVGDFVQAALGLSGGDDAVAAHLVLGHAPCGQHGGAGLVIRLDQLSETRLGAEDDVVGQKGGARLVAYQPASGPDRVPQPARLTLLDVRDVDLVGNRVDRGQNAQQVVPAALAQVVLELQRVVDGDLITTHVGGKGTFATPAMIGLMEITSHRSLENLLPAGHTTVGYEVHVRHVAPAAPGTTILVTTKLTEVKGNKLYFD